MVLVCIDSKQAAYETDEYRLQNTYFCHPSPLICTVQWTWAVAEIKIEEDVRYNGVSIVISFHNTYLSNYDQQPSPNSSQHRPSTL